MKKSRVFRASALVVGLSFVGVACGGSDSSSDTTAASSSSAAYVSPACDAPVASIGWQGVETGDYANLGAPMIKGAQLAIDEYNTANPDACVTLKKFDTQGDPAKAPAAAQAAIDDAHQHHDADVVVEPGVDDHRARCAVGVAARRRHAGDDGLKDLIDAHASLGRAGDGVGRIDADHVLDLGLRRDLGIDANP